jgi:hypothetical protein
MTIIVAVFQSSDDVSKQQGHASQLILQYANFLSISFDKYFDLSMPKFPIVEGLIHLNQSIFRPVYPKIIANAGKYPNQYWDKLGYLGYFRS